MRKNYLERKGFAVTYPRTNINETSIYLAINLGGVEINENDTIRILRAIKIFYFLRADTHEINELSKQYEDTAIDFVRKNYDHDPELHVRITDPKWQSFGCYCITIHSVNG